MGDKNQSMASEISQNHDNYIMWDKRKNIVILSLTKIAKNTIFVGDVNDTLVALKDIITKKTQRTDYMEEILQIITINYDGDTQSERKFLTQENLPHCISDVYLP